MPSSKISVLRGLQCRRFSFAAGVLLLCALATVILAACPNPAGKDTAADDPKPGGTGTTVVLDTTFNGTGVNGVKDYAGKVNDSLFLQVIPLADGKTLAVGEVQLEYDPPDSAHTTGGILARFNADGSLDTDFGSGGKVIYSISGGYSGFYGAAVEGSGNIFVAGRERERFAVWKYNDSGALDTSFSPSDGDGIDGVFILQTYSDGMAQGIGIDGNGKILVGGWAGDNGSGFWTMAFRLNADGSLDTTYGDGGAAVETRPSGSAFSQVAACRAGTDGSVVLAGYWSPAPYSTEMNPCIWRFTPEGNADPSFGTNGVAPLPGKQDLAAYAVTADGAGSYFVGGWYRADSYFDAFVAKLNAAGALVSSFGSSGYATFANIGSASSDTDDRTNALYLDGSGRLYLAGRADVPNKQDHDWSDEDGIFILRISASTGTRDVTFGANGVIADYGLLGGYEEEDSGTVYKRGKDEARALALDSSGRLLLGGGSLPAILVDEANTSVSNTPMAPFVARLK